VSNTKITVKFKRIGSQKAFKLFAVVSNSIPKRFSGWVDFWNSGHTYITRKFGKSFT